MGGTVWVVGELVDGTLNPVVAQLFHRANSYGCTVEGVLVGAAGVAAGASTMGQLGATRVHTYEDPSLAHAVMGFPTGAVVAALAEQEHPALILICGTYLGRDTAGVAAALLGATVLANIIDVECTESISAHSTIFGGTQHVTTSAVSERPTIVVVRPKSFEAESATHDGAVPQVPFTGEIPAWTLVATVEERHEESASGPKLEDAPVVVSGGRGLGDPKNFALMDELAGLLHGAVGASRAVVDAGWVPYAKQVGQTGKTVKPTVYIACGISGAMQHTVGMKGAKYIIAINKDEGAPIFKLCDLGVVGDALVIVPQIIEELKRQS